MKLLMDLYKIDSPSGHEDDMISFITSYLDRINVGYWTDELGNIYAAKGVSKHYPCLVSHMDEVHVNKPRGYKPVNFKGEVVFGYDTYRKNFIGIGADDKNGIWICLKSLKRAEVLKCVFFVQEEVGRIGSGRCEMSFFDDCRFVLQCDRKGNSDFINSIDGTDLCSEEFMYDALSRSYGYSESHGLVTDVYTLKRRGLKVSCANISCGYYNPHTADEYTRVGDLRKCLRLVTNIIEKCTKVYHHTFSPRRHRHYNQPWNPFGRDWDEIF